MCLGDLPFQGLYTTSAFALKTATAAPIVTVVAVEMGCGLYRDYQHGTTRNTAESAVGSICAITGGIAGATTGAAVGTMICPGVGTVVGTAVGSTLGAVGGNVTGKVLASAAFDYYEYNIEVKRCRKCGHRYRCRIYTDQSQTHCPNCDDHVY